MLFLRVKCLKGYCSEAFIHSSISVNKTPRKKTLAVAIHSPSAHNTQPRVFKILDEETLEVFYDPSRLLPIEDSIWRFLTATMWMLVESIHIASNEYGYLCEVDYPNTLMLYQAVKNPIPKYFCTIKRSFQGKRIENRFSSDDILWRSTSRLEFDWEPVGNDIISDIVSFVSTSSFRVYFSDNKETISSILHLNADTIFEDLRIKETRDEIWWRSRYSNGEAKESGDGLRAKCMNISGLLMKLFFRHNWLFNLKATFPFSKSLIMKKSWWVGTVCRIISDFQRPDEWFQSWRDTMKLWLLCHQHGVYMHPFGSIITNENTNKQLRKLIDIHDHDPENLWLVVRLWKSKKPEKSYRIPLDQKILWE